MVKRHRMADFLAAVAVFVLLFNVLTMVYVGFHNNDSIPWQYLIAGVPFLGFFMLREKVPNFNILIVAYIFFFILLVLILMPLTLVALVSAVGLVVGIKLNVDGKALRLTKPNAYAMFGGFVVLFVIGEAFIEVAGLGVFIAASALLCMLTAFLQIYLTNFDLQLQKAHKDHVEPARDVMTTGKVATTSFFATFAVLGGILILFPMGTVLINAFRAVISFIQSILSRLAPYELLRDIDDLALPPIDIHGDYDQIGAFLGERSEYYYEETNALLYLTIFALLIFLAFPLSIMIWSFIKRHKERTKKSNLRKDGTLDDTQSHKFRFSDITDLFGRNRGPKHPIRKAYIKKVRSHIKQGTIVLDAHTTDTIANSIRPKENIDDLTKSYDQARYGRE